MTDWEKVRLDSIKLVQIIVGKTVKEVQAYEGSLFIMFQDGTELHTGAYLHQDKFNDFARLDYQVLVPKGEK